MVRFLLLIFMSQIVLYFLHSNSALSYNMDVVLTLSSYETLHQAVAMMFGAIDQNRAGRLYMGTNFVEYHIKI